MLFGIEIASLGFYVAAALLMLTDVIRRQVGYRPLALLLLYSGFGLGTIALLLHVVQALNNSALPLSGYSQVLETLAWVLVAIVLVMQTKPKLFTIAALLIPFAAAAAALALFYPESSPPFPGDLPAWLFAMHILVLLFGMGSYCLAFFASLAYLVQQNELKQKRFDKLFAMLPSLEVLDRLVIRCIKIGLALLTVGILTGIYLAHIFWKTDWTHNLKFIFALVTWGWFLLLLTVRYRAGWRGGRFFALIVVGFLFLFFTFWISMVWGNPWI